MLPSSRGVWNSNNDTHWLSALQTILLTGPHTLINFIVSAFLVLAVRLAPDVMSNCPKCAIDIRPIASVLGRRREHQNISPLLSYLPLYLLHACAK